jgi:hypothetical protein
MSDPRNGREAGGIEVNLSTTLALRFEAANLEYGLGMFSRTCEVVQDQSIFVTKASEVINNFAAAPTLTFRLVTNKSTHPSERLGT